MKSNLKIAIFYILLIGVIIIASTALMRSVPTEELTYSDVIQLFESERVKTFVIEEDNTLKMTVRVVEQSGGETEAYLSYQLRDINLFLLDLGDTVRDQYERGVIQEYDIPAPYNVPWWVSFLPYEIGRAHV